MNMKVKEEWYNKYEMKERKYYNPRFGGNLKEFIRRMVEDEGFTIGALFPYYEGRSYDMLEGMDMTDYDEMAYRALNYEHTNMDFVKGDNGQTVSILMTGDAWCDVVPINDWSFRHNQEDVVDRVMKSMREEIMGEDA
jgi:hypothetical protein|tara:strand:- start:345 stop:758 length:414 start_codon:yes stop_codon:yes gene_type:complete